MSLSRLWLAARVGIRLISLPLLVRTRTLPALLERLGRRGTVRKSGDPHQLARIAQIVTRVCRMRVFDLSIFPRSCLRRSFALYAVLTRSGYPVEIHFGVQNAGKNLHGHSWVTVEGIPLGEKAPAETFRTIYSFPSATDSPTFHRKHGESANSSAVL